MSEDQQGTRLKREPPHGVPGSGFSAGLKRVFGDGENPLEWSVPVGRVSGIVLRMHLVFPIYVLSRLIWSNSTSDLGFPFVWPMMLALVVLVLAHELGHCYTCRRVGGRVDRVMMWPLGGLAETFPPPHWRASLMSSLGGPLVNLALWPVFAAWVFIATNNLRAVFFFPLEPLRTILPGIVTPQDEQPVWLMVVWSLHFVNSLLLFFNLLFPMLPLDGGRVMHALLWKKLGWKQAMEVTTVVGIVFGGVLGVFAVAGNSSVLLVVAGLGIWVCYQEHRRLKFLESGGEELGVGGGAAVMPGVSGLSEMPEQSVGGEVSDSKEAKARAEQAEVDRILSKISQVGMDGLSEEEKRTLKQVTKRTRYTE